MEVNATGSNTLSDGLFSDNRQKQFNVVNSTSVGIGGHTLKFGVDYRRLTPVSDSGIYKRAFLPGSIQALMATADNPNGAPSSGEIIAFRLLIL